MEKEKLMQKLKMRDYNKELEEVLASKQFSKNAKNLLSSMLYKIENSYEDYKKIKVEVPNKNKLLEEIIGIIAVDCDEIEIIKPNADNNPIPEGKKSIVIKKKQKIITYQNELALLKSIYELNKNQFNEENENLKEKALFSFLNRGEKTFKSEIIRDFDGWSWNIMTNEIEDYIPNLIYECFVLLIGYDKLNQNKNMMIEDLENMLKEQYKPLLTEKILKNVTRVAVLDYINEQPEEYEELQKLKNELEKTLLLMEDKKIYVEKITNQKKEYIKEIENIDKYINDDLKLKKEYIKQNEKLPQEQRVFSLSDFSEKIETRRSLAENEIKKLTEKMKPKNYVKEKTRIEKKLEFIRELNVEEIEIAIKDFVSLILKAINTQIEKIETKKEIIDKIYVLRYLKKININKQKTTGILCQKQFEKIEKKLITTGCNLKALNIFSQNVEENYKIYKNIFNTKIIDLESAYIEVSKENMVQIYDENSLEKEEKLTEIKELSAKCDKKIKIFI